MFNTGGEVGWGTALQTGRSRVRFPMVSLEFYIDIILPAALWPWGWLSLYQKWVPGIISEGKDGRCLGLTALPPSCPECLEIWKPQIHGTPGSVQTSNEIALVFTMLVEVIPTRRNIPITNGKSSIKIAPYIQMSFAHQISCTFVIFLSHFPSFVNWYLYLYFYVYHVIHFSLFPRKRILYFLFCLVYFIPLNILCFMDIYIQCIYSFY
jgi:hypothetical protein